VRGAFRIQEASAYMRGEILGCDSSDEFRTLLATRIPEPAHVLVILPHSLFCSPPPESIGRRKLVAMACHSTAASLETIGYFLDVIEQTNPAAQEAFAKRFFTLAAASAQLELIHPSDRRGSGTHATVAHLSDQFAWNLQAGPLEWGTQQLGPAGEISVLPAPILRFDAALRLPIDGELTFQGTPVLHAGTAPYTREDQARIHAQLNVLADHAVVAAVRNGEIEDLRPADSDAAPAASMLETLFTADARYRIVWEVGFGINTALRAVRPGNHAMNEVYGASNGVVHFGFGLTPSTQYALILPAIGTMAVGANGAVLAGSPAPERMMRRRIAASCGCHA